MPCLSVSRGPEMMRQLKRYLTAALACLFLVTAFLKIGEPLVQEESRQSEEARLGEEVTLVKDVPHDIVEQLKKLKEKNQLVTLQIGMKLCKHPIPLTDEIFVIRSLPDRDGLQRAKRYRFGQSGLQETGSVKLAATWSGQRFEIVALFHEGRMRSGKELGLFTNCAGTH